MPQKSVQIFIGRLVTDDAFRHRFGGDRAGVLTAWEAIGHPLNGAEREALLALALGACEQFARALDPRIRTWNEPGRSEKGSGS